VTATVYESREVLEGKYPVVGDNIKALEERGAVVRYGVDAMKVKGKAGLGGVGVGAVERVSFNFPHVGGKSTDVNRQVRYNQGMPQGLLCLGCGLGLILVEIELLVSFFKNAIPTLASSTPRSTSSIIVTLFEGEPYTLWNIRDLARHSGLQVERSFKFQAKAYPGYKHARTLGVVKRKNGEDGGGWKGEERLARSFVLVKKGEAPVPSANGSSRGKENERSEDEEVALDIDEGKGFEVEEESEFEGFDNNNQNGHEDEGDRLS
jgi:25S rRNA (uracil2634-N3)-methyltransferase